MKITTLNLIRNFGMFGKNEKNAKICFLIKHTIFTKCETSRDMAN